MQRRFVDYPFSTQIHSPPDAARQADCAHAAVVILGGGPVGLTAAIALAVQGQRSVLIEADDRVCSGSRAICISRRSLQILSRLGAQKPFLDKGLAWVSGRSYHKDREVLHFSMPDDRHQPLPPMLNIQQYYIEDFLLERAKSFGDLIDIHWATCATAIEHHADHVLIDLQNATGSYRLKADWLVAADGGQSFTRTALGLHLEGTSYEGRYVIADIKAKLDLPTERLAWFDPPSNPGSSVLLHRQPDDIWRIDYQIGRDEDPDVAVAPENVLPRIQQHLDFIGIKAEWEPVWITIYRAHALSLERYRHNRVLFAGDAAHLVPIFGVRGANSGIDDADNLGWKLAAVVQGRAGEGLLDSYCAERVFATAENLSFGRKSTEFMAPPSYGFEVMKQAVLALAVDEPAVSALINPRQSSTIHYIRSPLNITSDDEADFTAGPRAGEIFAEGAVIAAQGRFLGELLGTGCSLIHFGAHPHLAQAQAQAALGPLAQWLTTIRIGRAQDQADIDAICPDGALWERWDARLGTVYLLRPDGHVLARWRQPSLPALRNALASLFPLLEGAA